MQLEHTKNGDKVKMQHLVELETNNSYLELLTSRM